MSNGLASFLLPRQPTPDDGIYSCTTEEIVYWNGDKRGTRETLEVGEYVIEIDTLASKSASYEFGENLSFGRKVVIEFRLGGLPQLVIRHSDGKFTLRIALDSTPKRFSGLGPYAVLSGTCVFHPRASR
jgi:hypothetical protein